MGATGIRQINLDKLQFDPENARQHPEVKGLRASLAEFGQPEALVVQASTRRVVAGNGRLQAMRDLGWDKCWVRLVDWDDKRCRAYSLVANRTGELSTWDTERLGVQVKALRPEFAHLDDMGFDDASLDGLIADPIDEPLPNDDVDAQLDATPEPPDEPITQPGDVWILGRHRLTCGDCLTDLAKGLAAPARLVFCDPPYGVTANKWDQEIIPLDALWEALRNVSVKDAAYVWTATQPFATDVINSNRKTFRYDLIWKKKMITGFLHAQNIPMRSHESILLFGNSPIYNPQMTDGGTPYNTTCLNKHTSRNYGHTSYMNLHKNSGERYPISILAFALDRKEEGRVHPTQKPVSLLNWIVRTYTNEGDMVVDPTAGSGTTLIACERANRICHTVEKEGRYCDIIARRWEQLTGKEARREKANAA
jgi:DNA modification methylase